jgi:ribA/ribD-fused uncharacterized protein
MTQVEDPNKHNTEGHIKWFDNLGTGNEKYRFLSNFYEGEPLLVWQDTRAWTNEALFAAFKCSNMDDFMAILTERNPGTAKSMGRKVQLREDWEQIKYDVMMFGLRLKYSPEREEAKRLLATGDAFLQEGTYWQDRVWGTDMRAVGEPGRNWLGTMLMARRAELKAEVVHGATHNTAVANFDWLLKKPASKFLREYFNLK